MRLSKDADERGEGVEGGGGKRFARLGAAAIPLVRPGSSLFTPRRHARLVAP